MLLFMNVPPPVRADGALEDALGRMAEGEQDALAELYHQTRSAVYGFALSVVKHPQDAEDVLQDVYVQLWRSAKSYRGQGKPMAWILTIARNLALDRLRERGRTETLDEGDWRERMADVPAVSAEDHMTLVALLENLGDEERQIVTLHALTGLKHREIAGLLGLPLSTVLSKYNRALQKLRLAWKEAD